MKDMMLDSGTMSYELSEDDPPKKQSDSILDFDPVALAVQGTKKGSRYALFCSEISYFLFISIVMNSIGVFL